MYLAILSDIHGNLPALEAVAAEIEGRVDGVICLGDVVNYGPWNDECLELLFTLSFVTLIQGNHEELFLGQLPIERELPLVQQFFHCSFSRFTRADLISNLEVEITKAGYLFTHTVNRMKIYKNTDFTPPANCFIGHTHQQFTAIRGGLRVINPGSVGQNRSKLEQACYALLDTETNEVTLAQVSYPTRYVLDEMRARGYPDECVAYYESKL